MNIKANKATINIEDSGNWGSTTYNWKNQNEWFRIQTGTTTTATVNTYIWRPMQINIIPKIAPVEIVPVKKRFLTNKTEDIVIVLDSSGSMFKIKEETITGINDYVASLVEKKIKATLTLIFFDSNEFKVVRYATPLSKFKPLTIADYNPRGGTPLLDAIEFSVRFIDGYLNPNRSKLLVILTDGAENDSFRYNRSFISNILYSKQVTNSWTIVYLGANQDAWGEASTLGIYTGNTSTCSTANMSHVFSALSLATEKHSRMSSVGENTTNLLSGISFT